MAKLLDQLKCKETRARLGIDLESDLDSTLGLALGLGLGLLNPGYRAVQKIQFFKTINTQSWASG